ncbi:hypothetical protein CK215_14915 [Mesorhizobium sp. WSM3864]|nr:hypothetical protein CK215_14915 [Mesorhizobium sp. WSM3864]
MVLNFQQVTKTGTLGFRAARPSFETLVAVGREDRCGGYIDRKSLMERMRAARKPEDRPIRVESLCLGSTRDAASLKRSAFTPLPSEQSLAEAHASGFTLRYCACSPAVA